MKTMKIWSIVFAMTVALSSCGSDDDNILMEEENLFTEEEKANDLYKLTDVSFADDEPQSIVEHHLDTAYVYNYSYSVTMPVTYTMFDDLNDTLSIVITEGSEYVNRLRMQGPIQFPLYMMNGKPIFSNERPILMPIIQRQAVVEHNMLYTASTVLHPRTFLKYTGTYHCIINSCVFTAYYTGQATGEMVCVKGRFRRSVPTIASINGSTSTYAEVKPIP